MFRRQAVNSKTRTSSSIFYGNNRSNQDKSYSPTSVDISNLKVDAENVIGTGVFGTVYRGILSVKTETADTDGLVARNVAVKQIYPAIYADDTQAFAASAEFLIGLSHANIVQVNMK
jgi:hypothetical protein